MENERLFWIGGFLVSLIVGMAAALVFTWVLDPLPLSFSSPAALGPRDKEVFMVLIAAAYTHDGDLERARERLAALEDANVDVAVVRLAERYVNENGDVRDIRALAHLADSLGRTSAVVEPFLATRTPTATRVPTETLTSAAAATRIPGVTTTRSATTAAVVATARATATATTTRSPAAATATRVPVNAPTPLADRYQVVQSVALCDKNAGGTLRVYVRDAQGGPVPAAEIAVTWPGGSDRMFTGFKPEVDMGYADFSMTAGVSYTVALKSADSETAAACPEARDQEPTSRDVCPHLEVGVLPSWQVVFKLP